jgi:hypothetical protein
MSQIERQSHWQDIGSQADLPGGDDTACLVTASRNSRSQAPNSDRYMPPSSFVSSGWLRVQWTSTAHAQRLTHG